MRKHWRFSLFALGLFVMLSAHRCATAPVATEPEAYPVVDFPALTVSMDALGAVVPEQYGFNTAGFYHQYQANDAGLETLLEDLHPNLLRFPGGTTANFYHPDAKGYGFKQADVDHTEGSKVHKMMSEQVKREQRFIDQGLIKENFIHQFAREAKARQAEVLYVANLFTGTNDEIVQAIKILQSAGVKVRGIELGNEYYLQAYRLVIPDVESYLTRARSAEQVLRQQFPDIPLAVVAAPCPAVKGVTGDKAEVLNEWNQALGAESWVKAYVTHLYAYPVKDASAPASAALFDQAMHTSVEYARRQLGVAMDYYRAHYGSGRKAWVTEWNVQGVFQYFGNTFLQASYYCDFALGMMEHPEIELATYHNLLSGGGGFNVIGRTNAKEKPFFNNARFVARIAYHAALVSQRWYQPGVQRLKVDGLSADERYYTAAAFHDTKAQTASLLIVNRSGNALNLSELQLPAQWPLSEIDWYRIEATDLMTGIGSNPVRKAPDAQFTATLKESTVDSLAMIRPAPYSINVLTFPLAR